MHENEKNDENNNNENKLTLLTATKIFVYGIISPSIITFGLYYTLTFGIKYSIKNIIKDAISESFDILFLKKIIKK